TVLSRFCMNSAQATISAVRRVRRAMAMGAWAARAGVDSFIAASIVPDAAGEKPAAPGKRALRGRYRITAKAPPDPASRNQDGAACRAPCLQRRMSGCGIAQRESLVHADGDGALLHHVKQLGRRPFKVGALRGVGGERGAGDIKAALGAEYAQIQRR